ncbi:MAG: carbon starvation CstA family protein [Rikenellaceae bacterium]
MITFIICLVLLVGAYFVYGSYLQKVALKDANPQVPSQLLYDGVDYVPLPLWKTLLIQLLNIAGLGPIFGAVLGATYGPVAFLWITLGGIFFGAMHDYLAGMISLENQGLSLPEIIGKYLGVTVKQFMRGFSVLLMVLVGAVFICGPAAIIEGMTGITNLSIAEGITVPKFWIWAIFLYYILATLLPIDKIIGKIYPIFGAALIFMALGIMIVLFVGDYNLVELNTLSNMKVDADKFPILPTLFITIACGAISGFHATQSPLMARCINNPKEGRPVFFGAMIIESIIALVWAAIAMAFFGGVEALQSTLAEHGQNAGWVVNLIANTTLGRVGGILALFGVVAAPISSGDTAFRSARLIVADTLNIEQKSLRKRLCVSLPLFAVGYLITQVNFDVIWRYFAWINQTMAVVTLWAITVYLFKKGKNIYIAMVPAIIMSYVCSLYMFISGEMLALPFNVGYVLAGVLTLIILCYFINIFRKNESTAV